MTPEDIDNRFAYHIPSPSVKVLHASIREELGEMAHKLNALLPEGREKSLAITHLEEAMFWANAALARN